MKISALEYLIKNAVFLGEDGIWHQDWEKRPEEGGIKPVKPLAEKGKRGSGWVSIGNGKFIPSGVSPHLAPFDGLEEYQKAHGIVLKPGETMHDYVDKVQNTVAAPDATPTQPPAAAPVAQTPAATVQPAAKGLDDGVSGTYEGGFRTTDATGAQVPLSPDAGKSVEMARKVRSLTGG